MSDNEAMEVEESKDKSTEEVADKPHNEETTEATDKSAESEESKETELPTQAEESNKDAEEVQTSSEKGEEMPAEDEDKPMDEEIPEAEETETDKMADDQVTNSAEKDEESSVIDKANEDAMDVDAGEEQDKPEEKNEPEEEHDKPEEEHSKPEETSKPEEEHDKPEEEHDKPEEEQDKPEEEQDKPEKEKSKPEEEHDKPEEEQDKPEKEKSKPEEEHSKPEEEQDKPEKEQDKPEEEHNKPEEEQNKPEEESSEAGKEPTKPDKEPEAEKENNNKKKNAEIIDLSVQDIENESEMGDEHKNADHSEIDDDVTVVSHSSFTEGGEESDTSRMMEEPRDREVEVGGDKDDFSVVDIIRKKPKARRGGGHGRGGATVSIAANPELKLPFDMGWKRELVMRSSLGDSAATNPCDAYYFAPAGKKMRSLVQIADYLNQTKSTLTTKNFSFARYQIYKEPFDIVRQAGKAGSSPGPRRGRGRGSPSHTPSPLSTPSDSPRPGRGRPRGGGRGGRGSGSTDGHSRTPTPVGPSPVTIKVKRDQTGNSMTSSSALSFHREGGGSPEGKVINHGTTPSPVPPAQGVKRLSKGPVARKRTFRPPGGHQIYPRPPSPPPAKRQRLDSGDHILPCTMDCPGQQGTPPTQTCGVCMCMFHPACVGLRGTSSSFICKNCLSNMKNAAQSLTDSGKTRVSVVHPYNASNPAAGVNRPVPVGGPVMATQNGTSQNNLSGVANQQTLTGQLLTLPPQVIQRLDTNQGLTIRIDSQEIKVPASSFLKMADGVKLFLPPGTLPNQLILQNKQGAGGPNAVANLNFMINTREPQVLNVVQTPLGTPPKPMSHSPNVTKAGPRQPKVCHFKMLHVGFDCMLRIFQYLTIEDLLRASCVCRIWNKVASHNSLWKTVRLSGTRVCDWEGAARCFGHYDTHLLDLCGITHFEDKNRMWHQLTGVLSELHGVRDLRFGQCIAAILHAVSEKLPNLKALTAENITDTLTEPLMWSTNTKLDIGKMGKLTKLEQLKLRGMCGLILPSFSFDGGMTELSKLTNLKTLSLTTMRDIPKTEFTFLSSLETLENLEIGDCLTWDQDVYEHFAKLTKLRRLRLESSGKEDKGLHIALKHLKDLEHLELIKYAISKESATALGELKNLKTLCVWPETEGQAAEMNTNTLNSVREMTFLEGLDWGIMSDNNAIVLDNDDGPSDLCIALLPEQSKAGSDETTESDKPEPIFISLKMLGQKLETNLPDTKIRVFRVPVLNSQRYTASEDD